MNGRPAHEPGTHFPLRAVSWLQLSCLLLLLPCLPAGHVGLQMQQGGPPCKDGGATRGRTGVKARGGLRWVIAVAMRFVVACESRLTHIHTHPPTPTLPWHRERAHPRSTRRQIYTCCPPLLPPCDPALQQPYIFPYIFSLCTYETDRFSLVSPLPSVLVRLSCLLLLLGT